MKKTIATSLLMILMIIINVNVKAQVLNNVITDKNSFGPVESNNSGSNFTIINDSLYLINGTSIIKAQGTETMSFTNVIFAYYDFNFNRFYIGTQNNGVYMYNSSTSSIVNTLPGIGIITGYTTNQIPFAISTNNKLYFSTTSRIYSIDLYSSSVSTNTYISLSLYKNISGVTSLEYNSTDSTILYSTGTTIYKDKSATGVNLTSSNTTYTVNDMEYVNGDLYYATNQGVYNSNTSVLISDASNYSIIKSYNSNLYFAKSTGEIFKHNASTAFSQMTYGNTTNIVTKVNSISYAKTWDGTTGNNYYLFVSTDKGLFIDIADSIASDTNIFPVNRAMFINLPNSYVAATGIEESVLENTSGLYPVPNNGTFSYKTKYTGDLKIFSVTGKLVEEMKLEEGINKFEMNLVSGIYVAQFGCTQGVLRKRFVVN